VTLEVGYIGQGYQVPVPVSDQQLAALTPASLLAAFAEVYRAKYGYYYDDVPAELVNILVAGQAGDMPAIISALPESAGAATPRGARLAWSPRRRERIEFAIYDRNALAPGMSFPGPAMIEEASATTVIDCDAPVRIDRYGSIEITLPEEPQ
jgi:N-methylhydantoinase A